MGYTTYFTGQVTVDPPLNQTEIEYLNRFSGSRRMDRENGPYYAEPGDDFGQSRADDIRSFNEPPEGQPSLWCQWVPTLDGTAIEWDEGEKFYSAAEWMAYIIDHFLKEGAEGKGAPELEGFTFNHVVNGVIRADGEDYDDHWRLVVEGNKVTVEEGQVVYE